MFQTRSRGWGLIVTRMRFDEVFTDTVRIYKNERDANIENGAIIRIEHNDAVVFAVSLRIGSQSVSEGRRQCGTGHGDQKADQENSSSHVGTLTCRHWYGQPHFSY